eukprot:8153437-Pyramimonas_sp.AAC.1
MILCPQPAVSHSLVEQPQNADIWRDCSQDLAGLCRRRAHVRPREMIRARGLRSDDSGLPVNTIMVGHASE